MVGTPPSETPRQKLAQEARHRDIQAANESSRAATQASILINGGAATAILAYLSKSSPTPAGLVNAASLALLLYAIGVAFSAWSMWLSSQASAKFAFRWEAYLDNNASGEAEHLEGANNLVSRHRMIFGFSIVFFVLGCLSMAVGFLRA